MGAGARMYTRTLTRAPAPPRSRRLRGKSTASVLQHAARARRALAQVAPQSNLRHARAPLTARRSPRAAHRAPSARALQLRARPTAHFAGRAGRGAAPARMRLAPRTALPSRPRGPTSSRGRPPHARSPRPRRCRPGRPARCACPSRDLQGEGDGGSRPVTKLRAKVRASALRGWRAGADQTPGARAAGPPPPPGPARANAASR